MKKIVYFVISILFVVVGCAEEKRPPAEINDLIQPFRLETNRPVEVPLSDLFFSAHYDIELINNPLVKATYQSQNAQLNLYANDDAEGIQLLKFRLNQQEYAIPLIIESRPSHTFLLRPADQNLPEPQETISVFGSFNSWNRTNIPFLDEDEDGTYETTIALEPGRYEYKFYIDGHEFLDPSNPEKLSNPFGGFNSLLTIKPRHPDKVFLHLLGVNPIANALKISFQYEKENLRPAISTDNVIALINNQPLPVANIEVLENRIELILPQSMLSGRQTIRAAVSQAGQSTPIQAIVLENGRPLSDRGFHSWQDAIIYSLMIDRFADGDPDNNAPVNHPELHQRANFHGGDLLGVQRKIAAGYFDSLGVNTLWISPVNRNTDQAHREYPPPHRFYSAYHGYWPVHHQQVDPRFGNMGDLQSLTKSAHQKEMRVLLDFVANHTHIDHPFYKAHRDWYGVLDLPDGRKNIRFYDEFRLTTWFEPFLPSFDFEKSDGALEAMTDNAIWWLETADLDGFRHDAVKHIPNRFWRTLTRKIKANADRFDGRPLYQIGETFGGYDLISSYVNPGQLDGQFNFNLFFTARQVFLKPELSFTMLADELEKTHRVYGFHHLMGNLMDSHDQVRYMAYADGDLSLDAGGAEEAAWHNQPKISDPRSYRKAELYLAYLLTIPGVPIIYYGDEIGMTGAADPDNRRPMIFGEALSADQRRMFSATSKLIGLRRDHSALRYGDFQTLFADAGLLAYLRSDAHQRVLVVLNKGGESRQVNIPIPAFYNSVRLKDLNSGESSAVQKQATVDLPAESYRIFELR